MTTSYTSPGTSTKDLVRFYVGDCGKDSVWELTDEEITSALTIWTDALDCAAECCDSLAARYAAKVSTSLGNFTISDGAARFKHYTDLAMALRYRKASRLASTATPIVGGRTISGRATLTDDTDAIQPAFTTEQHDYPGTSPSYSEETDT
jgi:hypothetical protein